MGDETVPAGELSTPERRDWLLAQARANGRIIAGDVAAELGVAVETVRRDLARLERDGLVRRFHGGAAPIERVGFEMPIEVRAGLVPTVKERMAQAALPYLRDVDTVYLDEGSTVAALGAILQAARPLTVVTNSATLAPLLAQRHHLTVVLVGGLVRPETMGTVDPWATRMLGDLVLDLVVLGTNGITTAHGLTCPDLRVAAVKAAAIHAARRVLVLADSSRFGIDSSARFGVLRDVDVLITDHAIRASWLTTLRDHDIDVVEV
jgi:DeoR family fructose operon transcriptional repressor